MPESPKDTGSLAHSVHGPKPVRYVDAQTPEPETFLVGPENYLAHIKWAVRMVF
jgi:hypothetical protein